MQPLPRREEPEHPEMRRPEEFPRPIERPEGFRRTGEMLELRRDLVRWGPVFAGTVVALSTIVLLTILGAGIGLSAGPTGTDFGSAAGIWSAIVVLIALFVGGWVAAATSAVGGKPEGMFNGVMVWATLLVISLFLTAFGLGALLGAMTQFGLFAAPPAVGGPNLVATAWGTFIALLVGLGVAALGGYLGARELVVPKELQ